MNEKNDKFDYTKFLGYVLFFIAVLTWGISIGIYTNGMSDLQKDFEEHKELNSQIYKEQQEFIKSQLEYNANMKAYIEILLNENNQ
jgi:uncharacterized membrane protein (DUF106 family)